jgi:hypothetical protein
MAYLWLIPPAHRSTRLKGLLGSFIVEQKVGEGKKNFVGKDFEDVRDRRLLLCGGGGNVVIPGTTA